MAAAVAVARNIDFADVVVADMMDQAGVIAAVRIEDRNEVVVDVVAAIGLVEANMSLGAAA